MYMATVFLSAGHGGSDSGAVAYGLKEKEINLNTLLACNEVLVQHGVKTVLSRTKDENDPVAQEVKEANASGADLAVSFHANAGGGDGFEAFYYTTNAASKKLAQLGEKYVKELGQNSRGIKSGNHLWFVKKTSMTAVLFESFFVDNDKDNDIGDTVAEQRAFGVAYAKAILEYLGIDYNGSTVSSGYVTQTAPAPAPSQSKPEGYDEWIASLQRELNAQGFRDSQGNKLNVDGLKGPKTLSACPQVKKGAEGGITKLIQKRLNSVGFNLSTDGVFGDNTKKAVKVFQHNRNLDADGIVGPKTWDWLLKGTVM